MEYNNEPIPDFTKQENEEIWQNIFRATRATDRKRRNRKVLVISSVVLLFFAIGIAGFIFLRPKTYKAGYKDLEIILADNTKVTLLKGSTLRVDNFLLKNNRNVYLSGNALFSVSKSKKHPFIVHGYKYDTKVLGTVFKVVQNGRMFNVDLFEGKVQVSKVGKPKEFFILLPKQTFSNLGTQNIVAIIPTHGTKMEENTIKATISFTEVSLPEAVKTIESTYGIKINYPPNQSDTKLTLISNDATVEGLLKKIAIQLNLNIRNNDNTFELED